MSTRLKRSSNSAIVTVETNTPLRTTREGIFYAVGGAPGLQAKIYRGDGNEHIPKLVAMLDNPPDDPTTAQGHVSILWPLDVLYTPDMRDCAGLLMLRPAAAHPLSVVFNPITRRRESPLFNYRYLCRAARNLAGAIEALHRKGYVLGDINDQTALVTDTALITLIDTDSYQVFDPKHRTTYRCLSRRSEYTAPELQDADLAEVYREQNQDSFALAVLVFQLLMEGTHPFSSSSSKLAEADGYKERIHGGLYLFGKGADAAKPASSALPHSLLPPPIRELFQRCFEDGHSAPLMRPSAEEWRAALQEMEGRMVVCSANQQHLYPSHLTACPWCERVARLGAADPFPSREEIEFAHGGRHDAVQTPLPSAAASPAMSVVARPTPTSPGERAPAAYKPAAFTPPVSVAAPPEGDGRPARRAVAIAVIALLIVAAWAVLRPHHPASVASARLSSGASAAASSAPLASASDSPPAVPAASSAKAEQQAMQAFKALNTVSNSIVKNKNRTLTPSEADSLRLTLTSQCRAAESDCNQAIQKDPKCALAWQERIRGYRLLAEDAAAKKAARQAESVFADDPDALAQIQTTDADAT